MSERFPALVAQEEIKDTRKGMCNSMSLLFVVILVVTCLNLA